MIFLTTFMKKKSKNSIMTTKAILVVLLNKVRRQRMKTKGYGDIESNIRNISNQSFGFLIEISLVGHALLRSTSFKQGIEQLKDISNINHFWFIIIRIRSVIYLIYVPYNKCKWYWKWIHFLEDVHRIRKNVLLNYHVFS